MKKLLFILAVVATFSALAANKKFYAGVICYKMENGEAMAKYTEIKSYNVVSQDVLAKRAQLKADQAFRATNQDEEVKVFYFVNANKALVENLMSKKLEEIKAMVGEENVVLMDDFNIPND